MRIFLVLRRDFIDFIDFYLQMFLTYLSFIKLGECTLELVNIGFQHQMLKNKQTLYFKKTILNLHCGI